MTDTGEMPGLIHYMTLLAGSITPLEITISTMLIHPVIPGCKQLLDVMTKPRGYGFETINDKMSAEQQEIADTFSEKVNTSEEMGAKG